MIVRKHLRWRRVLNKSRGFLSYIIILSSLVYLLQRAEQGHYFELFLIHLPFAVVAMLATALAIFLAFRNNSAYDRWWEGRKKWGMIINRTRDFVRQSCAFVSDPQLNDSMTRWTVAFAITTKRHLRFERGLTELEGMFPAAELAKISGAKHMPLYCLERLSTRMLSMNLILTRCWQRTAGSNVFTKVASPELTCWVRKEMLYTISLICYLTQPFHIHPTITTGNL